MRPKFSARLPWDRAENALAALERARRARGDALWDLTVSNPTRVGLPELGARVREALAAGDIGAYEPAPAGAADARAAIAAELASAGAPIAPDRLLLTASSSESYAFLFKLLCDPGDAVLVPEPSYPLFDYLARLEGIEPVPYRLAYDGAWHVDFASVDDALARADGRARALIVVNPNNPTGSFLKRLELPALAARCEAHGLAVIADEVFALYAAGDDRQRVCALAAEPAFTARVPTFALGGLSKSCALPQLKLGWMIVAGPPALARDAMERLEPRRRYVSVRGCARASGRGAPARARPRRAARRRGSASRPTPRSSRACCRRRRPARCSRARAAGPRSCASRRRAPTPPGPRCCSSRTACSSTPATSSTSRAARSSSCLCCRRSRSSRRAYAASSPAAAPEPRGGVA